MDWHCLQVLCGAAKVLLMDEGSSAAKVLLMMDQGSSAAKVLLMRDEGSAALRKLASFRTGVVKFHANR